MRRAGVLTVASVLSMRMRCVLLVVLNPTNTPGRPFGANEGASPASMKHDNILGKKLRSMSTISIINANISFILIGSYIFYQTESWYLYRYQVPGS